MKDIRRLYKFNPRTIVNLTATATPAVAFTCELSELGFTCSVWQIGTDGPPLHTMLWRNPLTINQAFIDWGYTYDVEAWK